VSGSKLIEHIGAIPTGTPNEIIIIQGTLIQTRFKALTDGPIRSGNC